MPPISPCPCPIPQAPAPQREIQHLQNPPRPENKPESHRTTRKNKLRTAPNHPHNPKPICWCHRKPKNRKNPYRNADGRSVRSHRVRASLSDPPDNPKEPIPTDRRTSSRNPEDGDGGNQQRTTTL
ncbi:hypothetical protein VC83_04286 [Pseudogymnoascus destructans]|uniref:Uncharacterized protein n=1 Tax=Pseudogymnoascus destructans TaxID=655981 RepID=A0A177AAS6_9PEZI|nr:uncharacterized protein VC83_04286 [Pseudogymnoascus destructans]OAF59259.1 hypothetical protein VC83_04286 [Pseudogymnoascus destructans]